MDNRTSPIKAFFSRIFRNYEWKVDFTENIPRHDIRSSRYSAALGYIVFIIPWVFHDDKQFARFHCNQSLINLLMSTIGAILLGSIPYAGPVLVAAQEALCLIWMIRGIVLSLRGKAVSIPLVGWITLIPYRIAG